MIITTHFLYGIIAVIIGGLPFGLVNLSVVDATINRNEKDAFSLSVGASLVEILFALVAIYLGSQLTQYVESNSWINYLVLAVLLASGIFFTFKKHGKQKKIQFEVSYFLKGFLLNLISIQVLLYWFLVIAYLKTNHNIKFDLVCTSGFLVGVLTGKMMVLLFYRIISTSVKNRSKTISKSINLIIGIMLILIAFIQGIKISTF